MTSLGNLYAFTLVACAVSAQSWVQVLPPNHPSPRTGAAMVDTVGAGTLLFGGSGASFSAETWSWTGADWSLVH